MTLGTDHRFRKKVFKKMLDFHDFKADKASGMTTALITFLEGNNIDFSNRMLALRNDPTESKKFLQEVNPTYLPIIATQTARNALRIGLRNEWANFLTVLLVSEAHRYEGQISIVSAMLSTIRETNSVEDANQRALEPERIKNEPARLRAEAEKIRAETEKAKAEEEKAKAQMEKIRVEEEHENNRFYRNRQRQSRNMGIGAGTGAGSGAALGALIGTAILPGVGSLIGGLIGAAAGSGGGTLIGANV
ncbi:MAG: hypothetical protein LBI69_05135 [Puniceicoccales bacterium]|jgi:hypothetical protein|nr:hypothetical protein [Puniceicoccales bacterium]